MSEEKKYEEIMKGIKQLEIGQAVTNEKISNMNSHLKSTNARLNEANTVYEKLEQRVDAHDKIVGAICISVAILTTLVKYKII